MNFAIFHDVRTVLCVGAHSDDIEIGCGGTLLSLVEQVPDVHVVWVVLSGCERRATEARLSAAAFLSHAKSHDVRTESFRDGFFPYQGELIKEYFELLKSSVRPDVILTHHTKDLHQDHRLVGELTWNTFRDHLILEYEIPKYDGGMGSPNLFMPLSLTITRRKLVLLQQTFQSQHTKRWYDDETFRSILRLRGMECNAPEKYAEAFYVRKMTFGFAAHCDNRGGRVRLESEVGEE